MPQVMLQDHHKITLPKAIVQQAHICKNDVLDVSFHNGSIILKLPETPKQRVRSSIMDYAGIAEGLYGESAEEVRSYVDELRADRDVV